MGDRKHLGESMIRPRSEPLMGDGISLGPDGLCGYWQGVWSLVTTVCRMLKQCIAPPAVLMLY
eukprot:1155278-Pelagomonas_calceolata.AAC.1